MFCLEELKDFNKLHDSNYRSFCITGDTESNIKYILIMEHPRSRDGNDETIKKINNTLGKNALVIIFNILPKVEPSIEKNFSLKIEEKIIIEKINNKIKKILEKLLETKEYEIILACGQHIFTQVKEINELSKFYLVEFLKIINKHKTEIQTTKLSKNNEMPIVGINYPLIRTVSFGNLIIAPLPKYEKIKMKYDNYIYNYVLKLSNSIY